MNMVFIWSEEMAQSNEKISLRLFLATIFAIRFYRPYVFVAGDLPPNTLSDDGLFGKFN